MSQWLINGETATGVPADDRGLAYGDGLFETIALRDGAMRFLDYHLDRLSEACEQLGLPMPPRETLHGELKQAQGNTEHGTAKLILTRGSGPRGYRPPAVTAARRLIRVYPGRPDSQPVWATGIRVRLCKTRLGQNPALAGLKTLNRLEQVLARGEWDSEAIAEGLMQSIDGDMICGTMSNLFLVRDDALWTPDLGLCGIRGIMRRVVMETAAAAGIPVHEARLGLPEVHGAREIFLCNSQFGVAPVTRLEERELPVGSLTRKIQALLAARGVRECAAG